MTRDARHIVVAMGQLICVRGNVAPGRVVFANRLRIARLLVVVATSLRNGVDSLGHTPPATGNNHRVLHDVAGFQVDILALFVFAFSVACYALEQWNASALLISNTNARQVLAHQRLVLTLATLGGSARHRRGRGTGSKQRRFTLNR